MDLSPAYQLLADLGIDPAYIIALGDTSWNLATEAERAYIFERPDTDTLAFTAPHLDVLLRTGCLQYEWRGRGFCVVFRQYLRPDTLLGVTLHELAHYHASFDDPSRDEPDPAKAAAAWRPRSEAESHDRRWLRACVHLHGRACSLGWEINLGDVVCLPQYGYSAEDLLPLLAEASRREGEPIEAILASPYPGSRRKGKGKPPSGAKPAATTPAPLVWGGSCSLDPRQRMYALDVMLSTHPLMLDGRYAARLRSLIDGRDAAALEAAITPRGAAEARYRVQNGVAVVPVIGILADGDYAGTNYGRLEADLAAAYGDDEAESIWLYVDSPGGSALGCGRVANQIFNARGLKPLVAFTAGMCASAAYYIAAACDRIEATADSLCGSIGTILPHMEMSGALREMGVGVTVITNADSPKKSHGNAFEPLTEESRETLDNFVDSYGAAFIRDVATYRGLSEAEVIANYGGGDALRGDRAVERGIVDSLVEGKDESFGLLAAASRPAAHALAWA
ncbi:MAG TPA: S49 family peptidase [Lacipirellulaceae bacterium]|nr:S49 family peptidase [Lacipirellulaceae bacterium]